MPFISLRVFLPNPRCVRTVDEKAFTVVAGLSWPRSVGSAGGLDEFRTLATPVERSDYLRMLILHDFGGVYLGPQTLIYHPPWTQIPPREPSDVALLFH